MHLFNVATILIVVSLLGVEFSVSAFVHPAARRLAPKSQLEMLSRFAFVLGRVMPVWYPVCGVLFLIETYMHWQAPSRYLLLAADAIWLLTSVATIFLLVPLNTRVAQGAADWRQAHNTWDTRHRVRIVALGVAAILLLLTLAR